MRGKLRKYRRRRDFGSTTEPHGDTRGDEGNSRPRFVVQKHDASTLHYDFRLEAEGVLKSWALPKGPSIDPRDKRLAIRTEDHPLDYADFEGVIPEGEYGAGTVLVWDSGSYGLRTDRDENAAQLLDRGRIDVWLEGHKLRGGYTLLRMSKRTEDQWLLVKMADEGADRRRKPLKKQPRSVRSGADLNTIAAHGGQQE
ncbi:DNA ligase D, 3'-phosphoesterase domain-containing protein [Actinopolyspora mzabensis]|uniref:DNA ligase D, 3'-phosphoesterase domain-containing protein n=1 Tax=Actinopolyspora mzabensis TaxID=995066 RepID=A0A1G9A3X3_ACTMZ|nr:DNA polymerase ligase N-terminal domain-containing protein [Actinopolyspora mzabensis]SDK22028.1 DNA ligase D, 3'-phosphoesterase domain-containing protein [Actinopolyspora mzabensis]